MLRLFVAPRGPEIVALMLDYGLLPAVLGVAPRPTLLARLAALEAALGLPPDAIRRLSALAAEVPEDAERLRERLRLSNAQAADLARAAVRAPEIGPTAAEAAARAYLYRHGQRAYRERVLLAWTRSGDPPRSETWRSRLALPDSWRAPVFPLSGADVLALGVPAGPRVGDVLRALEEEWIAGDFRAGEPALRSRLEQLVLQIGQES
jgi:poly(A) polymerase